MNIHPLTSHYSALRVLPGVIDVQPRQGLNGESVAIKTVDAAEASFLDDILADTIKGRPVEFSYDGPEIGVAPKPFYPAEEIIRDYGSLLNELPGVTHLGTVSISCGEWLPAFETGIEVVTENNAQATLVSELLETEVAGTKVVVRSKKQKFDRYGKLPQFSMN